MRQSLKPKRGRPPMTKAKGVGSPLKPRRGRPPKAEAPRRGRPPKLAADLPRRGRPPKAKKSVVIRSTQTKDLVKRGRGRRPKDDTDSAPLSRKAGIEPRNPLTGFVVVESLGALLSTSNIPDDAKAVWRPVSEITDITMVDFFETVEDAQAAAKTLVGEETFSVSPATSFLAPSYAISDEYRFGLIMKLAPVGHETSYADAVLKTAEVLASKYQAAKQKFAAKKAEIEEQLSSASGALQDAGFDLVSFKKLYRI